MIKFIYRTEALEYFVFDKNSATENTKLNLFELQLSPLP